MGWLTGKQKLDIIAMKAASPGMTHQELAAWATTRFKLPRKLSRPTVSGILRSKAAITSADYGNGNRCRPVKVTSLRLEKRLWAWISNLESRNICLSRELITMKAKELQGQLCDAWDLSFSDGWLTKFMERDAEDSCHQELLLPHGHYFQRCRSVV
eukprot:jgi/Phyca11/105814/e_gw1.11.568.1